MIRVVSAYLAILQIHALVSPHVRLLMAAAKLATRGNALIAMRERVLVVTKLAAVPLVMKRVRIVMKGRALVVMKLRALLATSLELVWDAMNRALIVTRAFVRYATRACAPLVTRVGAVHRKTLDVVI